MISTTRKPGKNIQPPCVSCARKESPTSILSWNQTPQKRQQIFQVSPSDSCEGLNNDSNSTKSLTNLSLFFSDPASFPSSTQSPARSPTNFPLLLQSPKQKITLISVFVTNSVPSSPASPVFETTGTGQMEKVLNEYQIMGNFTINMPSNTTIPFQLFIRMPSQFDTSYQVYIPDYVSVCSRGTIGSGLTQESDGVYATATVTQLSVGNGNNCAVSISVVLRQT